MMWMFVATTALLLGTFPVPVSSSSAAVAAAVGENRNSNGVQVRVQGATLGNPYRTGRKTKHGDKQGVSQPYAIPAIEDGWSVTNVKSGRAYDIPKACKKGGSECIFTDADMTVCACEDGMYVDGKLTPWGKEPGEERKLSSSHQVWSDMIVTPRSSSGFYFSNYYAPPGVVTSLYEISGSAANCHDSGQQTQCTRTATNQETEMMYDVFVHGTTSLSLDSKVMQTYSSYHPSVVVFDIVYETDWNYNIEVLDWDSQCSAPITSITTGLDFVWSGQVTAEACPSGLWSVCRDPMTYTNPGGYHMTAVWCAADFQHNTSLNAYFRAALQITW